jgi:hypothetical protein
MQMERREDLNPLHGEVQIEQLEGTRLETERIEGAVENREERQDDERSQVDRKKDLTPGELRFGDFRPVSLLKCVKRDPWIRLNENCWVFCSSVVLESLCR